MKTILLALLFLPGLSFSQEYSREEWEQYQVEKSQYFFNDDYQEELRFSGYRIAPKYPEPDSARDASAEELLRQQNRKVLENNKEFQEQCKDPNGWKFYLDEWIQLRYCRPAPPAYYRHPVHGSNGGIDIG